MKKRPVNIYRPLLYARVLLRRCAHKGLHKPVEHALVFGAGIIGLQLLHGGDAVLDLLAIGEGIALNVAF